MKKKIVFFSMICMLTAGLSAKQIGLVLDIGPLFTHTAYYDWGVSDNALIRKSYWSSSAGRIGGGFDVQLRYTFYKKLGVYTLFNAAFPARPHNDTQQYGAYLIDWQLGLGWTFNLEKNFDVFFGGGLAAGGTGEKTRSPQKTIDTANVGFGVNCIFSYMFTHMVGMYFGVSDNIYVPVNRKAKIGSITTSKQPDERLVNALNLKLGLQLAF